MHSKEVREHKFSINIQNLSLVNLIFFFLIKFDVILLKIHAVFIFLCLFYKASYRNKFIYFLSQFKIECIVGRFLYVEI